MFESLEEQPPGIEVMYRRILSRIDGQSKEDASTAHRVFLWLLHANSSLSIDELRHALAVSTEASIFDAEAVISEQLLLSTCGGLVTRSDTSKVDFIREHTSLFPPSLD